MNNPAAASIVAPSPWLARLPPSLFGIPFGLLGLAGAWQRLVPLGITIGNPLSFYLFAAALTLFAVLTLLWCCKIARHPAIARLDWQHPVHGSLLALAPMTLLLGISMAAPILPALAEIWLSLVIVALAFTGLLAWQLIARMSAGRLPPELITPALYLPTLGGGFIGSLALHAIGLPGLAALLAGMAVGAWALLEGRVLNRLFAGPLPPALRATIGLEIAPAAISSLVAATLWPALPVEVLMLCLGIACGPVLTVMTRWRSWTAVPFSAGFWSFSFPLAAMAGTIAEAVRRGGWPPAVALTAVALVSLLIAYLALRTLALLANGGLLPARA